MNHQARIFFGIRNQTSRCRNAENARLSVAILETSNYRRGGSWRKTSHASEFSDSGRRTRAIAMNGYELFFTQIRAAAKRRTFCRADAQASLTKDHS